MKFLRLIISVSCLSLVACGVLTSDHQGRSFDKRFSTDHEDFKIGENFDRVPIERPAIERRQVFQMYRTGMGPVGTGIYLGKIGDRHLAMTAGHVYHDMADCTEEVNFLLSLENEMHYFTCSGWSLNLSENDVFIFEFKGDVDPSILFQKVPFSRQPVTKHQPLKLLAIDRHHQDFVFQWSIDTSEDCQVLDANAQRLKDPDKGSPSNTISWSIPIGCDAHDGDSGAPVYNGNDELVGIVWTGQYPKEEFSAPLNQLSADEIWKKSNFMIPVTKIFEELQTMTGPGDESTRAIVSGILNNQLQ